MEKTPKTFPFLLLIIGVLLALLLVVFGVIFVIDFHNFTVDFHKAYFPDYSQAYCCDSGIMGGNGYENYGAVPMTSPVDEPFLAKENAQWATDASASSTYSQNNTGAWASTMATGKPDVYYYGDNGNAWAPLSMTGTTMETLTLNFAKPVYATAVNIKESYGSGAIVKVELGTSDNLISVWEGDDPTRGLAYLEVAVEKTTTKIDVVKITFDIGKKSPNEWSEIDAVQLVGTDN